MKVKTTTTGLKEWRGVLADAPADVVPETRKVVAKASLNIKNDAKKKISGLAHAPHYPRAIGYDTAVAGTKVTSEIGPDKRKPQGALGNILEYGSVNNAPLAHLGPALDFEVPNLERYLGELGEDLLT